MAALALGGEVPAGAGAISMQVNGWTSPPVGYVDFCRHTPDQCRSRGASDAQQLTSERWRDLVEVNAFVNHAVSPATDHDFYRAEEVWRLPETFGDCEDYVLLKRKWLTERGWPTGSLLVTVVFDEFGDGHAVLLARTNRGEFVLDNKTNDIRVWYETAYRYVKRQSVEDPNRWVALGDPRWSGATAAQK
jgi:predicted transglutaminase-like cysteine proteinase